MKLVAPPLLLMTVACAQASTALPSALRICFSGNWKTVSPGDWQITVDQVDM
jgi:hypothetical protein